MPARSRRFKEAASVGVLLLAALIWGLGFVAQRSGMQYMGPFFFNGIRSVLAALVLLFILLFAWLINRTRNKKSLIVRKAEKARDDKNPAVGEVLKGVRSTLIAGLICGTVLFCATNAQQIGMVTVTASKAAFITTLYIVLVPILGIFLKQGTRWNTWVSVGMAVAGLYLLCIGVDLRLELGDSLLILCALFWAGHILVIGYIAPRLGMLNLFGMCVVQFLVVGGASFVCAVFFDQSFVSIPLSFEAISHAAPELLYAGVLSTGVAFTLATIAQRYVKPTPTAIVMSTESVFGLLGGVLLLGEVLLPGEAMGCLLMLAAVLLAQLEFKKRVIRQEGSFL